MSEKSHIEHLYQDEEAKRISFTSYSKKYKKALIKIFFSNHNEIFIKKFKEEYRGMGIISKNKEEAEMLRFWGKKNNFHLKNDGTFEMWKSGN